jgi:hypothetical protein
MGSPRIQLAGGAVAGNRKAVGFVPNPLQEKA